MSASDSTADKSVRLRPSMHLGEVEAALEALGFTRLERAGRRRRGKGSSHQLWVDTQGRRVMVCRHGRNPNPEHVDNLFHKLRRMGYDVSAWFDRKG